MTAFSVKMPDDLHAALDDHLKAIGQSRSAFVRGLIERELRGAKSKQAELRARVMALAGALGRDDAPGGPQTNSAGNAKRILREAGYGLDNARRSHR